MISLTDRSIVVGTRFLFPTVEFPVGEYALHDERGNRHEIERHGQPPVIRLEDADHCGQTLKHPEEQRSGPSEKTSRLRKHGNLVRPWYVTGRGAL